MVQLLLMVDAELAVTFFETNDKNTTLFIQFCSSILMPMF